MNVRITPREGLRTGSQDRPAPPGDAGSPPAQVAQRQGGARSPLPGAYRYSSQLNEQLTTGQRALDFVESLSAQLEAVKSSLSQELTQRRVDPANVAPALAGLAEQWSQRGRASGGSVDARLRFLLGGDARRTFTIRGLDMASLEGGQAETLTFMTGQSGVPPLPVGIPSGADEETVLRQFNQGLSRAGIRAGLSDQGQLEFSVAEDSWPALQERMAIKGGGVRLPDGQPSRVRLEASGDAIRTEGWPLRDHAEVRRALKDILAAIDQVGRARAAIASAMAEARRAIDQLGSVGEEAWASGFVADFNATLSQPGNFQALSQVIPALSGINRFRVISLLAL